jgi:MFS family permease
MNSQGEQSKKETPSKPRCEDSAKRNRIIAVLGATSFLLVLTFSMNDMILSILVIDYYRTALIDFAVLYAVFVLIGGASAAVGGRLADKHGRKKILMLVTVTSVLA